MNAEKGLKIVINAETADAVSKIEAFFATLRENAEKLTGISEFMSEFGRKLVGLFAVGSIVEFTKHAIELDATLESMSKKTGISVGVLEQLREESTKTGVAFEDLDSGLVTFADHIFQAVRHGGEMASVFRDDLKIGLVEANGQIRPMDDLLLDVARKFQAMPAGAQKAALAMELFGRSGKQFIQLLSLNTKELVAQTKEHGAEQARNAKAAEELHIAYARLGDVFEDIWRSLGRQLVPALTQAAKGLTSFLLGVRAAVGDGAQLKVVIKEIAGALVALAAARSFVAFGGIVGGVSSWRDLAVAAGLYVNQLKAMRLSALAAFPVGPIAGYLAYLTAANEALTTYREGLNAIKAKENEENTRDNLADRNEDLLESLRDDVDKMEKAGVLLKEKADEFRFRLVQAATSDVAMGNPSIKAKALSDIAKDLQAENAKKMSAELLDAIRDDINKMEKAGALLHAEANSFRTRLLQAAEEEKPDTRWQKLKEMAKELKGVQAGFQPGPSDREMKMAEARIQSLLRSESMANEELEAANETSYKKREILVKAYFATKEFLLKKSTEQEANAIKAELKLVDQQRRDPANKYNTEKQDELKLKAEELRNKLLEVQQKLRIALKKLSGEQFVEEDNAAKKAAEIEQGYADMRMSHIQAQQALIQSNPYLTDIEKSQELVSLFKQENHELDEQIARELKRQRTTKLSNEELLESARRVQALRDQQAQLNLTQRQNAAGSNFHDSLTEQFAQVSNAFGTLQGNLAKGWANVVTAMRDGMATAIDDMIYKGMRFKQAMSEFGLAILHSMVTSFAQITADWIMQHTVMSATSSMFHLGEDAKQVAHTGAQVSVHAAGEEAKTGATAAGSLQRGAIRLGETIYHGLQTAFRVVTHIAGEIAMTAVSLAQSFIRRLGAFLEAQPYIFLAAVKAAASVADIPFVGPILAPIAAATTFAALEALAVFKRGGYTGDGSPDEVAGAVHRGEYVFTAAQTSAIGRPTLAAIAAGRMPLMATARPMNTSSAGRQPIQVHMWGDRAQEMQEHIKSNPGVQHEIISLTARHAHKFVRR